MKKVTVIISLFLLAIQVYSQEIKEIEVKSEVNEVTVYIEGAQVTRNKTLDLPAGQSLIKFVNLSPFIDGKSVQVKTEGNLTVLSVNHQQNFIDKAEKSKEASELEAKIEALDKKLDLEKTYLSILKEEINFLQENRSIGGKNQELSVSNLKEASAFYSSRLTEIKLKEIERNKTITELHSQKNDLESQLNSLSGEKEFASGEILVKVKTTDPAKAKFSISYLVNNAGWYPTYDIRSKTIDEPLELIYKANVRQDTKVDWNKVKLRFSSANPKVSASAPELKTYFLGYNSLPPTYNKNINSVSGKVFDSNNEPLPGTTVMVKGTTIGTVTDTEGHYSITVPSGNSYLDYSFIGFKPQTLAVNSEIMNVTMEEDQVALDEVVVTGYGTSGGDKFDIPSALTGSVAGISTKKGTKVMIRGIATKPLPTAEIHHQTTVDFEIEMPYSIKSDNKSLAVDMAVYSIPTDYQYFCIPKIEKDAFLLANITDWEKYNLLEGEANLFFEDTYVGKSLLNLQNAGDTLKLSLGRDKNISIFREKVKDFTNRKFIGTKQEVTKTWKTTVKNNKSSAVNLTILDQVPVSTNDDIEVKTEQKSGGVMNEETGELKWEVKLKPQEKKEYELRYLITYPKHRNLVIE